VHKEGVLLHEPGHLGPEVFPVCSEVCDRLLQVDRPGSKVDSAPADRAGAPLVPLW